MNTLFEALMRYQVSQPDVLAIRGSDFSITYGQLFTEIEALADQIVEGKRIGLALDNSPAWVVADLALLWKQAICVPIPAFFSPAQTRHLIDNAQLDAVLTDRPDLFQASYSDVTIEQVNIAGQSLHWVQCPNREPEPDLGNAVKLTYTSGTTGTPKGVSLSENAIMRVMESLSSASVVSVQDRGLSLLPLATLLENIAGVYVPLFVGGSCTVPSLAEVGLHGASGLDVQMFLQCLHHYHPTGLVLVPQMLQVMVEASEAGLQLPDSLRFVAVGGAPVSVGLLERAREQKIPVYEGYGLSEACSVVSLNTPEAQRLGSVGRPLTHVQLRIADDNEIWISGAVFEGYLGSEHDKQGKWFASGDLGYLDEEGFLHLTGRKKNMFVTAYGRNVAPEWVERELLALSVIAQVAVFGEAKPYNVAVIVPRAGINEKTIDDAVAIVNQQLPDYARVSRYLVADQPFTVQNGQLTGTGRPRRTEIESHHRAAISALYDEVTL